MSPRLPIAVSLLALALAGCQSPPSTTATADPAAAASTGESPADVAFAALSARYVEEAMALSPVWATGVGDHRHDHALDDWSAGGRAARVAFYREMKAALGRIDAKALTREHQVDALILGNALDGGIWELETMQDWAWDPQLYSGLAGGALYGLMARDFAPLPTRMQAAVARMEKIRALLAQARENLDPARVPPTHAETVARQNRGLGALIDTYVLPHADQLQGADRARLDAAVTALRAAIEEHQAWLDGTLVPNARGDFRIGRERYDEKLRFALNSSLSREEIRTRAEAELRRVREEMYGVARTVLAGRAGTPATPESPTEEQRQAAILAAIAIAEADRPAADEVVDVARHTLEVATAFVREHDLVTIPAQPLEIIVMPEYQRGVAVAYADSPGPLDKGLPMYYAISPPPADWSPAQVQSFLSEYNRRMMHVLTIHEAMPGHYLEGAHSVENPSLLRAVHRSGPFAEGWAVYAERMVADAGYLDRDPLFRLMQLKFYARSVANAILDQGLHVDGWTKEQAMDLMVRQSFQQQSEADGKWVRAQLSSTQLPTYFVGASEHFDMRRAVEEKEGDAFSLKRYHDRVLATGAPPVRFARQLLLDEPIH
jgi:uncharacterized protein (DUF885 family)